jgi:hypothetical protein
MIIDGHGSERYIAHPGRRIYVSAGAGGPLLEHLAGLGREVIKVDTKGIVAPPVSGHPDMFMCRLGIGDGAPIFFAEPNELGPGYPADILFNAACTGLFFIHSLKHTSPELLKKALSLGMMTIDVKQGYTKCSTVIVDEHSLITYDEGIASACAGINSLDVLLVSPGGVSLPGYPTGFIGGASGRIGDEVIFNGDLSLHPDFNSIRGFIEARGLRCVWFPEYPLTDIGSII